MTEMKVLDRQQIRPAPNSQHVPEYFPDLRVSFRGTVSLFHPLTDLAREWMGVHCPADDDHQYFCGALVVEARYVEDLIWHAQEDGLAL